MPVWMLNVCMSPSDCLITEPGSVRGIAGSQAPSGNQLAASSSFAKIRQLSPVLSSSLKSNNSYHRLQVGSKFADRMCCRNDIVSVAIYRFKHFKERDHFPHLYLLLVST